MGATWKYNILPHSHNNKPPAQLCEQEWTPHHIVYPFGTVRNIPDSRAKTKLSDRARPVRFLYDLSNSVIAILHSDTGQIGKASLADFKPHHHNLDPAITMASAFKTYNLQAIPTDIYEATLTPQ